MERAIVRILRDASAVSAIVGTRIYAQWAPSRVNLPYLTVQRISTSRPRVQGGTSDIAEVRIQVNCWHTSYSSVKALSDAVRAALDGYRGTAGPAGGQTTIKRITCVNEADSSDAAPASPEDAIRGVVFDFMVWYAE